METKLITRRGCGGSVSTPSAGEGRLFIKSHVSRVPRRPINSPWRFLLWPWTNLIHISCRSPPPSACFRRNIRNIPRTRILWRSWSFTRRNDASRARVRRRNEFSSKARWEYNDSDISYLLGDLPKRHVFGSRIITSFVQIFLLNIEWNEQVSKKVFFKSLMSILNVCSYVDLDAFLSGHANRIIYRTTSLLSRSRKHRQG